MKRFATVAVMAMLAAMPALRAQDNRLTRAEEKAGWQLLFDGADTKGWHEAATGVAVTGVRIEDGVLTLQQSAQHQGDIVTDRTFTNFELLVDFNIAPGGNSGVKYLVNDEVNAAAHDHQLGFEYQILDDDKHPDAKLGHDGIAKRRRCTTFCHRTPPVRTAVRASGTPRGLWCAERTASTG